MDSKVPKIFVIVLNFNGEATLLDCLASVFQSDYPNFEVVVVDNDSKDGSFEKARLAYSRAHFIKNPANVGFAKGNNVGIRFALEKFADHVFLLNNDAFIKKNTLAEMVAVAEKNPSVGIVSPLIKAASGDSIWFAGGTIDWKKMRTVHLKKPLSLDPYATEYVTGCAMLVKKEVFKKIGLFDERFFLYYEDADFSMRAKKNNFDLMMIPSVSIRHLEQSNSTNERKIYWLVLSGLIFFNTHSSSAQKVWLFFYLKARKLKNFCVCIFSPNKFASEVRRAYQDHARIIKQ